MADIDAAPPAEGEVDFAKISIKEAMSILNVRCFVVLLLFLLGLGSARAPAAPRRRLFFSSAVHHQLNLDTHPNNQNNKQTQYHTKRRRTRA